MEILEYASQRNILVDGSPIGLVSKRRQFLVIKSRQTKVRRKGQGSVIGLEVLVNRALAAGRDILLTPFIRHYTMKKADKQTEISGEWITYIGPNKGSHNDLPIGKTRIMPQIE